MNHQIQGEQIKQTTQDSKRSFSSITESAPATHDAVESGRTMVEKVSNAAHAVRERVEERGAEALNQAKRKAGKIYDQANKSLNEQYGKAMGYGRENPAK